MSSYEYGSNFFLVFKIVFVLNNGIYYFLQRSGLLWKSHFQGDGESGNSLGFLSGNDLEINNYFFKISISFSL